MLSKPDQRWWILGLVICPENALYSSCIEVAQEAISELDQHPDSEKTAADQDCCKALMKRRNRGVVQWFRYLAAEPEVGSLNPQWAS